MGGMAGVGSGCLGSFKYLGDVNMNKYVTSGKIWRVIIILFSMKIEFEIRQARDILCTNMTALTSYTNYLGRSSY